MKRLVALGLLIVVALTVFGACGKDSDKDEADEKEAAAKDCPAAPKAITANGLPASFPTVDGVVFTKTGLQGPSTIVDGYAEKDLGDVYSEYKKVLAEDPYAVTKSERDPHDAEVNYSTADGSGQVRLGEACKGRTSVRVVFRPS